MGGAIGYAACDVIRYVEHLPNAPTDDRNLPDLDFEFYDVLIVFDNVNKTVTVLRLVRTGSSINAHQAYDEACLPAGTVSGAPKVRAMEIIDELEPSRRGPYAGAVGYFDYRGNMDTRITLRTMVI